MGQGKKKSVSLTGESHRAFKEEVHRRGEDSIDGTAEKLIVAELNRIDLIAKAHSNLQNKERRCLKRN